MAKKMTDARVPDTLFAGSWETYWKISRSRWSSVEDGAGHMRRLRQSSRIEDGPVLPARISGPSLIKPRAEDGPATEPQMLRPIAKQRFWGNRPKASCGTMSFPVPMITPRCPVPPVPGLFRRRSGKRCRLPPPARRKQPVRPPHSPEHGSPEHGPAYGARRGCTGIR